MDNGNEYDVITVSMVIDVIKYDPNDFASAVFGVTKVKPWRWEMLGNALFFFNNSISTQKNKPENVEFYLEPGDVMCICMTKDNVIDVVKLEGEESINMAFGMRDDLRQFINDKTGIDLYNKEETDESV